MKITMVSQYHPKIGGIENVVSDLSGMLTAESHEIHVVTPLMPGTEAYEVMDGIHIHRFSGSKKKIPFRADWIMAMKRMIEEVGRTYGIDLIHAHYAKNEGLVATYAGRRLGVPVVITGHGTDLMFEFGGLCEKAWGRYWVRHALRRSDAITTVSEALRQNVLKLGIDGEKVKVIHNWIDPSLYDRGGKEMIRRELGIEERTILTARRFVPKNGVDILINAIEQVETPCRLLIVGEGPEKHRLQEQAKGRSQGNSIEFLGFLPFEEYVNYLRASDVFVIPSRWEGFGMVALEAMSARTPVVATNVGGLKEIIMQGENGILVEPDGLSIARGIQSLLDNKELASTLACNAMTDIMDRFSSERAIKQYRELYEQLMKG